MARPVLDVTRPDRARVYDYWLGGKDNFAADREAGEEMLRQCPGLRTLARENRAFVIKAVQWVAAMKGITQFLDLGCGLPAAPSVHEAARAGEPEARVVYVDKDPLVLAHVAALERGEGLAAVKADVTVPGRVLEVIAGLAGHLPGGGEEPPPGLIDFGQPVCVILGGTLSDMSAGVARETVAGYAQALAPGSAAIISCVSFADEELAARMAAVFAGGADAWRNHGPDGVTSFFAAGGLRLVHGRVMDVACWPACSVTGTARDAAVLGGVGITGGRDGGRDGR